MIQAHRFIFISIHAVNLVLKHHPQLEETIRFDYIRLDNSFKYALFLRFRHPLKQFFETRGRENLTVSKLEKEQLTKDQ